ncbi:HU family DNA-binding protein [Gracilimonas mengyeensis]|uniref:DNA-binding protein n=1 Tax=Gracilimonas mengyeensis TaxID=1302730 RepID=A0A521BWZ9_9BACT|nr:HU family DNA-binding protein [Gracilimonas mengyeensis]SMO51713.1 DNA-binding protein [Gracilimonas mengyeensis]
MTNEFLKNLGMVIRDQIIMKNSVEIDGLGTFKAVHKNQKQEKRADGTNIMVPPKDVIEFTAERKG